MFRSHHSDNCDCGGDFDCFGGDHNHDGEAGEGNVLQVNLKSCCVVPETIITIII